MALSENSLRKKRLGKKVKRVAKKAMNTKKEVSSTMSKTENATPEQLQNMLAYTIGAVARLEKTVFSLSKLLMDSGVVDRIRLETVSDIVGDYATIDEFWSADIDEALLARELANLTNATEEGEEAEPDAHADESPANAAQA
jgi:hypothetical protein